MGRILSGAMSGLLFLLGVALLLQQYGVRPLDTVSLVVLPVVGLVLGGLLGRVRGG